MKNTNWYAAVALSLSIATAYCQDSAPAPQPSALPEQAPGAPAPVPANIPPSVAEVIRLAESGTSEDVLLAYVQNSNARFDLSADTILYLKDVGLPSSVVTAMLNHNGPGRGETPGTTTPPYTPLPQTPPPQQAPPVQEQPPTQAPPSDAGAAAPTYVGNPPAEVNYFYNDLAPYGTWVDLAGVGWCWQPRTVIVARGWRPYCDGGRWVYSDCGWYWHSDYSWGWAPFHYGRWQLHDRCGWVWTPDHVWGPAWVTWRRSGDYCGWAPLPPRAYFDVHTGGYSYGGTHVGVQFGFGLGAAQFTFVATKNFNDHDLGHHQVSRTEVKNVYNNTTVINNYTVKNNTVVNNGIPVEHVAAATHTTIRKAVVQETTSNVSAATRRASSESATPVVFRRDLKPPVKNDHIVAQKVDDKHPIVQHAPIAAANTTARNPRPLVNGPAASNQPRIQQRDATSTTQRQVRERTSSPTPNNQPAPKTAPNNAPQPTQPAPAPNTQGTTPRRTAEAAPASHAATPAPAFNGQAATTPKQNQADAKLTSPPYYPKTYHQNSDIRSLPSQQRPESKADMTRPNQNNAQSHDHPSPPANSTSSPKHSDDNSSKPKKN